jgi:hypothetical protein
MENLNTTGTRWEVGDRAWLGEHRVKIRGFFPKKHYALSRCWVEDLNTPRKEVLAVDELQLMAPEQHRKLKEVIKHERKKAKRDA